MKNSATGGAVRAVAGILAGYRIAHMIAKETGPGEICDRLREYVKDRYPPVRRGDDMLISWQAEGIECPLCISFWVSLPLALLVVRPRRLGDLLLAWLGIAGADLIIHLRLYNKKG